MNNLTTDNPVVASEQPSISTLAEHILLGLDLHTADIRVVRQIGDTNPQPAQRFTWENIDEFILKQKQLAKKVYVVYEAGCFGYFLCRRLMAQDIQVYIVHAKDINPINKKVRNDKNDALRLAQALSRYVHGDHSAMTVVRVPTVEQEQKRLGVRHRYHLKSRAKAELVRGMSLLRSIGILKASKWWVEPFWKNLQPSIPSEQMRQALDDGRRIILLYEEMCVKAEREVVKECKQPLPYMMGKLTFVTLLLEIGDWNRFNNRRQVGCFTGLCGGISSSGPSSIQLSITKQGNARIRAVLIELAWRMVLHQPQSHAVAKWDGVFKDKKAGARARKKAIVAVARQLAIDLWKWQTDRATFDELGWTLKKAA